jgi:hypothetical protein
MRVDVASSSFRPIVINIESEQEFSAIMNALNSADSMNNIFEQTIIDNLKKALHVALYSD